VSDKVGRRVVGGFFARAMMYWGYDCPEESKRRTSNVQLPTSNIELREKPIEDEAKKPEEKENEKEEEEDWDDSFGDK